MNSSLFIFHKESKFRKMLISLVVSNEVDADGRPKNLDDNNNESNPDTKPKDGDNELPIKSMLLKNTKTLEDIKLDTSQKRAKSFGPQLTNNMEDKSERVKSGQEQTVDISTKKEKWNKYWKKKCKNPSKYFDYTIIALILTSSLLLILDNPLNDPNSEMSKVLENIDFVFTFLFFIEAAIKIIALGFLFTSIDAQAYIRNGWNFLDFIVVMASLLDFFVLIQNSNSVDTEQLSSLKALRALRALRPLRMISRNEGMRLVVNALFASIPSMTNVLIVCLLFILIFASTGISFFAGKFYRCMTGEEDSLAGELIDLSWVDNRYD